MRESVREVVLSAPDSPGVYIFKSKNRPIYIGKAKSLARRLKSYLGRLDERMASMVETAEELEVIPVRTEEEALRLEANLIRRFKPRYNVRLKDGNPFLYIHLSSEKVPAVKVVRRPEAGGVNYGPFLSRKHVRDFLRFARKLFPIRNCSLKLPARRRIPPCIEYHIGRCLAPCAYDVEREYDKAVEGFKGVLEGRDSAVLKMLYDNMMREAEAYNYEAAALWRDRLRAFQKVLEERRDRRDMWVIRSYGGEGVIALYVLKGERVEDVHTFYVSLSAGGEGETLREFLSMYYVENTAKPDRILTYPALDTGDVFGIPVESAEGHGLLGMALDYAQERLSRMLEAKERVNPSLEALRVLLNLPKIPERIEGFDVSHLFGDHRVASMVVFLRGHPHKPSYRRFRIKDSVGVDDYAAVYEVITRRIRRAGEWPLPDLILVDGGTGQLNAALRAVAESGLDVPVIALAKRRETLHLPGGKVVNLPLNDPALRLLMRVRDEAHRFALAYHRTLRDGRIDESVLNGIPGIGKKRKMLLLSKFGSVEGIRRASLRDIASLPGFGFELAKRVKEYLSG